MFTLVVSTKPCRRCIVFVADYAIVFDQRSTSHNLPMLGTSMRRKEPRKHKVFPANLTLKRFLTGVEVLVFYSMRAYCERFLTRFALVLGGTFVSLNVHLDMVFRRVSVFAKVARIFIFFIVYYRMQGESHIVWIRFVTNFTMNGLVFLRIWRLGWLVVVGLFSSPPFRF